MEQRTVSDIINLYQPLLRKFEKDETLIILEAEEEPGCKLGDNYMSIVIRTRVTGKRGNGEFYSKSLMTKYLPRHRQIIGFIRSADLFANEAHVYEKLLPILGNFGPPCLYADSEKIVMEDLKPLGYVLCERRDLLDLEHCIVTVKILAGLHASSLALKLKNPSQFLQLVAPLQEAVFPQDSEAALGMAIETGLKSAIEHLDSIEPKTEKLRNSIEFLRKYRQRSYDLMRKLVIPGKHKYNVVTHGDCWNNNILFKYDPNGRVVQAKLLDYQISRHVSPAIDFHYFMYSSPKSSIIENNYEKLVWEYHEAFVENLRNHSVPDEDISTLSMDWFEAELKKHSEYGLLTGCWLVTALLAEENEAVDMDNLTVEYLEKMENKLIEIRPKVAERLQCIVSHFIKRYQS